MVIETVSIRAPARGATQRGAGTWTTLVFQFALPRGERPLDAVDGGGLHRVSIRAPARGATQIDARHFGALLRFNSRSREGSDA